MGFFGIKSRAEKIEAKYDQLQNEMVQLRTEAKSFADYGTIVPIGTRILPFNGEKSLGEIGPIISYLPDYNGLAARSWQAYLESPLAKTIAEKWTGWIIDQGLRLKANPARLVLESEGIEMTKAQQEKFNDVVEARWNVWSDSKNSSWHNQDNFAETTRKAYINSKIGGDILVVLRYDKCVKIQLIDGMRIAQPFTPIAPGSKNVITNGVEIDPTGKVVAYHIRKSNSLESYSIPAYSKSTGLRTAFLVKGSKWRLDYHRGLPVVATVLESLKKIERYQEATVGSAEEVAKIAYQVVHQNFSDGSTPLQQQLAKSAGLDTDEPTDMHGEKLVKNIAATTGKSAYNNPKGAEIKTINHSNNLTGFENFYNSNANIICPAIGIPPNVALSIYNDSFSASRAATKDWDHSMDVERSFFTAEYYSYIYKFWLYMEVLTNKIQAPGYLQAFQNKDFMITESYESARFTGPHFPHINPLVEVQAERLKLGTLGAHIPLSDAELSCEALGSGDSDSIATQFADELKIAKELGLEAVVKQPQQNTQIEEKK